MRKDKYASELEDRVLRAKDAYFTVIREKEDLLEENQEMAQLLRANGIHYDNVVSRSLSASTARRMYARSTSSTSNNSGLATSEGSIRTARSTTSLSVTTGHSPLSPARASAFSSHSPVSVSGFSTDSPIGTAITTNHRAPSTASVPYMSLPTKPASVFDDDQVSLNFVLQYVSTAIPNSKIVFVRS